MPQILVEDLFSLSIPERIQLVEDLWDSIAVQSDKVELTAEIKCELDKRLADYQQDPQAQSSWHEVRARLWRML
jgi:putative addiction module component (TIGR02574 family)